MTGGKDLRGRVAERRRQAETETAGSEVARRDEVRGLLESMSGEFASALPAMVPIDNFLRVALTGLKTTPGLASCSRSSLLAALLKCATAGLLPCTEQASIIPFKGEATFVAGYQGYIEIFHRTGLVARVELDWIYEADDFEHVKGDNPSFRHWPNHRAAARGEVTHAYAFLRYKDGGRSDIVILNRAQAEKIRARSKAYTSAESNGKRDSTWHSDFEAMWLKSCIRRLSKYVPKSSELRSLLAADDADDPADDTPPAAVPAAQVVHEPPAEAGREGPAEPPAVDAEAPWPETGEGEPW